MSAILDVSGVDVDLARRPVLRGITLRVDSGQLVGILGPNGAGKTTLLRAMLGMIPVRAGRVLISGRPPARARDSMGFVPQRQEFAWDFPISVTEAVLTGRTALLRRFRGPGASDYAAVDDAIGRVGLTALRNRPVAELSGGQRQRVLVARALALRPALLLLDEPFTGLDMPAQEQLTDLFERLRTEGQAIVMTTHDIAGAVSGCSRVVLLNRSIRADGAARELADPALWMSTFDVRGDNPLLRTVAAGMLEAV